MNLELLSETPQGQSHPTPLLFVHGKWHGAWCWAEYFLPYFAQHGYHAYALSLRGHGGSEGRIRGNSIAHYVADIDQIAAQITARHKMRPALIGHSMGGYLTQKYLENHTLPAAVLLTSIPHYGLWPVTFSLLRRRPLLVLKVLVTLRLYPVIETPALAREALFSAGMPAETVLRYHRLMCDESFRAYLDELGLNLAHPKRVKTPLLVIGAQNDTTISPRQVKATARAYKTKAEIFPDMAHDVMLEAGWQKVADRILAWLEERLPKS